MFNRPSIAQYYDLVGRKVAHEVSSLTDRQILGEDMDGLEDRLIAEYGMTPIEIDGSRKEYLETVGDASLNLCIPVVASSTLSVIFQHNLEGSPFTLTPSTHNMEYSGGLIRRRVAHDESSIGQARMGFMQQMERWNAQINQYDPPFRASVKSAIQNRLDRAQASQQSLEQLSKSTGLEVKSHR